MRSKNGQKIHRIGRQRSESDPQNRNRPARLFAASGIGFEKSRERSRRELHQVGRTHRHPAQTSERLRERAGTHRVGSVHVPGRTAEHHQRDHPVAAAVDIHGPAAVQQAVRQRADASVHRGRYRVGRAHHGRDHLFGDGRQVFRPSVRVELQDIVRGRAKLQRRPFADGRQGRHRKAEDHGRDENPAFRAGTDRQVQKAHDQLSYTAEHAVRVQVPFRVPAQSRSDVGPGDTERLRGRPEQGVLHVFQIVPELPGKVAVRRGRHQGRSARRGGSDFADAVPEIDEEEHGVHDRQPSGRAQRDRLVDHHTAPEQPDQSVVRNVVPVGAVRSRRQRLPGVQIRLRIFQSRPAHRPGPFLADHGQNSGAPDQAPGEFRRELLRRPGALPVRPAEHAVPGAVPEPFGARAGPILGHHTGDDRHPVPFHTQTAHSERQGLRHIEIQQGKEAPFHRETVRRTRFGHSFVQREQQMRTRIDLQSDRRSFGFRSASGHHVQHPQGPVDILDQQLRFGVEDPDGARQGRYIRGGQVQGRAVGQEQRLRRRSASRLLRWHDGVCCRCGKRSGHRCGLQAIGSGQDVHVHLENVSGRDQQRDITFFPQSNDGRFFVAVGVFTIYRLLP